MSAMTIIRQAAGNEYLSRALQHVADYQRIVDMRDAVQAKLDSLTGAQTPPNPVRPDQLDDWLTATIAAADQQRVADQQHRILTELYAECTNSVDNIVYVGADAMLTSLAADLNEVMAEVGNIATKLKGATTPAAAIELGVEKPWRQLPELRAHYDQIRAAQLVITPVADPFATQNAVSPYLVDDLASDLLIANLDELIPGWRQRDNRINMGGTVGPRQPWPTDPAEQLLWLATSTAQPWVPTSVQLADLNYTRTHQDPVDLDETPTTLTTTINERWTGTTPNAKPLRTARAIKTVDV